MEQLIKEVAREIKDRLINIRRDFHMHPELAMEELRTAGIVAEILSELGLEVQTGVGNTGVVGVLRGAQPGKTIALRADMDALPIEQQNDVPYKSKYPGKMHACGHDGHTAIALGAAMILSRMKDSLKGNVKFVFQPAEENAPTGGAKYMIEDGLLENPKVDAIVGLHLWPDIPLGKVGVRYGSLMASSDRFKITINGKGGHGSAPHQTIDAVAIGCQVVTALQNIVSRQVDPLDAAVLTVGTFNGGYRYNVIADKVEMEGTVRTLNPEIRNSMENRVRTVVDGVCGSFGATAKLEYYYGYPTLVNNNDIMAMVEKSTKDILGEDVVKIVERPAMGGEDFAFYLQHVPGGFIWLGCPKKEGGNYPIHNPNFDFDEDALETGSILLSKIAVDYLKND